MKTNFTLLQPMAPLWLAYPSYHRYCIGWRMGDGESYKDDFWDWYQCLTSDEQSEYQRLFPAPKMWAGIYDQHLPEDADPYGVALWTPDGKPAYGLPQLIAEHQTTSPDYLFFWGHKPSIDGKITKSCFSQWWQSPFSNGAVDYCCTEQYMMASKAVLFADDETEANIMNCQDPGKIKAYGRQVKNFDEELWDKYKYTFVLEGNFYKFSQNKPLLNFLLSTKQKILVEASPLDKIWGIGLAQNAADVTNPSAWRGENLLGFALMEVRAELHAVYRNYEQINWNQLHKKYHLSRQ